MKKLRFEPEFRYVFSYDLYKKDNQSIPPEWYVERMDGVEVEPDYELQVGEFVGRWGIFLSMKIEPQWCLPRFRHGVEYFFSLRTFSEVEHLDDSLIGWAKDCDGKPVSVHNSIDGKIGNYIINPAWCVAVERNGLSDRELVEKLRKECDELRSQILFLKESIDRSQP